MEFFLSLLLKSGYFSDIIMNQWAEVLNTDLRICSNTHFIWPKNVSAFVNLPTNNEVWSSGDWLG
jgi:hypothetical protein